MNEEKKSMRVVKNKKILVDRRNIKGVHWTTNKNL